MDKEFKRCRAFGSMFPVTCEAHGDRFKELPADSGRDGASSPPCAQPGGAAFNLSKSIYHFSYWLISRAPR